MAEGAEQSPSGEVQAVSGRQTSDLAPVVVRKTVTPRSNYQDYKDDLREDFLYSCAYCSITEAEAQAVGFNIDHYMPQEHYPTMSADYENLMWSCQGCNSLKSDYPKPGRVVGERRVIKVDHENPRQHLMLKGDDTYTVTHRTPTGEFNIKLLLLNRSTLRRLREVRRRLSHSVEFIAHGMSELLAIDLDNVDRRHRGLLLGLQRDLPEDFDRVMEPIRRLIEKTARSPFLDSDPNHKLELAARREYLRSEKAIAPGVTPIPKRRTRRRRGTARKRR